MGQPGQLPLCPESAGRKGRPRLLRDPANAAKLGVDTKRLAIMGHSMGGWVTAMVAGEDDGLIGAGLISAANMEMFAGEGREAVLNFAAGTAAPLAGTSPEAMTDELFANREAFHFLKAASALARKPLLVLTSDDGFAPMTDGLIKAVHEKGGTRITRYHAATDHSWSDRRIDLAAQIIRWLQGLEGPRR